MSSRSDWPFVAAVVLSLCCALLLPACASTSGPSLGAPRSAVHEVSVQELLGRPGEFDGQPVRVIGVAGFDTGYEGRLRIYTSRDDQRHASNSYIRIAGLSPDLGAGPMELGRLSGKFVVVEGIFRATPLDRLPQAPGSAILCTGDCGASGTLSDVNRIGLWEF